VIHVGQESTRGSKKTSGTTIAVIILAVLLAGTCFGGAIAAFTMYHLSVRSGNTNGDRGSAAEQQQVPVPPGT